RRSPHPPPSPPFPYTTLFRSSLALLPSTRCSTTARPWAYAAGQFSIPAAAPTRRMERLLVFPSAPYTKPSPSLEGVSRALAGLRDRKSTRLNSSHVKISYAVF